MSTDARRFATTGHASGRRSTLPSSRSAFDSRPDGSVVVEVHQIARALDGALLAEGDVRHVYAFEGDLVVRMDVEEHA